MSKKRLVDGPWMSIWFKPRETIRSIVAFNPRFRFAILSFLYGLPMLFHSAQNLSLGKDLSLLWIVIAGIVLATFIGMLGITISSALIYWTGKWIGGQSSYLNVRAAVSWSNVPNIIAIIVWGVLIYLFQNQVFIDEFGQQGLEGTQQAVVAAATVMQAIVSIWSFVILVKGLGEVQGFSAWKGVLNVLIPFFLVGILIWLVTWIFWAANGMMATI